MPLQNRVQPDGEIISSPTRGSFMGNRGILHGPQQTLGTARWRHKAWVCCVLAFKNRKRALMAVGNYTELFFLDEAFALAAGHRPCAECRRADYLRFVDAWEAATGHRPRAPEMDAVLHPARVRRDRSSVSYQADAASLPAGTMISNAGHIYLLGTDAMYPYTVSGYGARVDRLCGAVTILTPKPTVAVLANGYTPQSHATMFIEH